MRLRLKVQRHLVVAWKEEDNGEWVFTLCRKGFSEMIGHPLRPGEEWVVSVSGFVIEKLSDKGSSNG